MPKHPERSEPDGAPSHPEEMKAVVDMRLGRFATLQASYRITPAGVVTLGLVTVGIIAASAFACVAVERARR